MIVQMGRGKSAKHRSGRTLRVEPSHHDVFDIYPEIGEKFKKAGWMPFILTLNGYHPQVAMAFAQKFNGFQAQVGGMTMYISKGTIAETFKLDVVGDRWFKKGKVDETLLNQFLPPKHQNPNWSKDENIFLVDVGFVLRPELDAQAKQRWSRKKSKTAKQSSPSQEQDEHHDLPPEISKEIPKVKATSRKRLTEVTPKTRITWARNKFRLNSKALLKLTLKISTPVGINSGTPFKHASKKKFSFYVTPKNPLFQLTQVAKVMEETVTGMRCGKKTKVTGQHVRGGQLKGHKRNATSKRADAKAKRGRERSL